MREKIIRHTVMTWLLLLIVAGNFFCVLPKVTLKNGATTITATTITVTGLTNMVCIFPITAVDPGNWDVMVTNTDTKAVTAVGGYTVTIPYHTATFLDKASPSGKADNAAKVPLYRLTLTSTLSSEGNDLQLASLKVKLTGGDDANLSTPQATDLFQNVALVADNPTQGTQGSYQPAYDTTSLTTVPNASISIDGSGYLSLPVDDPTAAAATVAKGGSSIYFVVGEIKAGADSASLNNFKAVVSAGDDIVVRDSVYHNLQGVTSATPVTTTALTAIAPATKPTGSSYPATVGAATETLSGPAAYNRNTDAEFYVGGSSGKLYAVNADGTAKWSTPFDTGYPITSAPRVIVEGADTFIYVANDNGDILKIKDLGSSGTTTGGWSINLGAVVKSEPIIFNSSMYVGSSTKLYKINTTTSSIVWDSASLISGKLTGSAAVDEFTSGMNSVWIGSEDGSLYRLNTSNGAFYASMTTGSTINSSPYVDAGWSGPTNNLFITSTDGKIYCKSSANLETTPWTNVRSGQTDGSYSVGSPINTTPFLDVTDNSVYFGADNGKLYKLNAADGTLTSGYPFTTGGAINSSPIVYNGTVYFGSDDGKCYALNSSNGTLKNKWPVTVGAEVKSMPVLGGWNGSDYVNMTFTCKDGKVYAYQIP